jgi:hypothetical protein
MTQHDPTPAIEVWARMLCAADVHVYGADHPTWQQLVGEPGRRIRDDYRKAAAWLLPRMTAAPPPADRTDLRDLIAAAIWERQNPGRRYADCEYRWRADAEADADAVLAVLPTTDRAAVRAEAFEEAADMLARLDPVKAALAGQHAWNDAAGLVRHMAVQERRMADEAQTAQPAGETAGGGV